MIYQIKLISLFLVVVLAFAGCMKTPMACCDVPSTGLVGVPINFNSGCSLDASSYEWDFGDGQKSTEANPTHTYTTTGAYTIKFMAMSKNEKLMDETTKSININ